MSTQGTVKILHWSSGAGEWSHYGYFESIEEYFLHIKRNGYDIKYFKVDKG
jgi:hypothetical protein